MKKLLLLSIASGFCLLLNAQPRVALVAGGHQSNIAETNDRPDWQAIKNNYQERGGVHLGFIADLPFSSSGKVSFQPGAVFYNKGRKFTQRFDTTVSNIATYKSIEYINYVDIPMNLVLKLKLGGKTKFILGAGPYASFFYNGKLKTETYSKGDIYTADEQELQVGDGDGKYSTLDYGVNGLAGFEFGRVFITANYSRGLKDIYKPATYTATDYKNEVMGVTLGIFLGKQGDQVIKDKDGDGVPDKTDACPDIAGSIALRGCPDRDNDGVSDNNDRCPDVAGVIELKGCPYPDTDKDGINDKNDKCPDVAGPADNNGCPYPDTDRDGILDKDDKCPAVAGIARYNGCPIPDTDGDGINDEMDRCPTVKGIAANNGCPEIKKEIIAKVQYAAKKIQFTLASAKLTTDSYAVLDNVAALLKANPELKIAVEGHSSIDGKYDANVKLSQERAESVTNYLQKSGISIERMSAKGFGPDKPLSNGTSIEERRRNRRVELILSN